jgi:hypothetical protein
MPLWLFWLKNWGFMTPLALVGFGYLIIRKQHRDLMIYGGFLLAFVAANIIKFQPSTWDNSKVFLWVYLGFSFMAAKILSVIWKRVLGGKVLAVVLFVVLGFSGFLDLARVMDTKKNSFVMISKAEIELAGKLREISEYDDLVLTSDYHLHWVPVMSGRRILMGYRGWLWSYGINYSQREREIFEMYSGLEDGERLLRDYGVDFVVFDDKVVKEFEADEAGFSQKYELVISAPGYRVYRL